MAMRYHFLTMLKQQASELLDVQARTVKTKRQEVHMQGNPAGRVDESAVNEANLAGTSGRLVGATRRSAAKGKPAGAVAIAFAVAVSASSLLLLFAVVAFLSGFLGPQPHAFAQAGGNPAGGLQGEGETVAGFKIPDYNPDGTLKSVLTAGIAVFRPSEELIDIKDLKIDFYDSKTREVEMKVTSPKCLYSTGRKRALSDDTVLIERDNIKVTGVGFEWTDSVSKKEFIVKSKARVELRNMDKSALEGKNENENK